MAPHNPEFIVPLNSLVLPDLITKNEIEILEKLNMKKNVISVHLPQILHLCRFLPKTEELLPVLKATKNQFLEWLEVLMKTLIASNRLEFKNSSLKIYFNKETLQIHAKII
jgi:hypothetical protein